MLTFVSTRGAGLEAGDPYEARFPDKYGNLCVRHVARPQVISNYFKYSNKVDVHNQVRQFDIALEKKWVTPFPCFRLYTTQLGMNLTDSWKAFKRHHKEGGCVPSATEFADITAYETINEAKRLKTIESDESPVNNLVVTAHCEDSVSCLSNPVQYNSLPTMVLLQGKKQVR